MAWEDWFLRLDPYNFETKEQQEGQKGKNGGASLWQR